MSYILTELADHLGSIGMTCRVEAGNGVRIEAVNTLEDARPTEISFLANKKYAKQLGTTRAGAVVVPEECAVPEGLNGLRTADPYAAVTALVVNLHGYRKHPRGGVSPAVLRMDDAAKLCGEGDVLRGGGAAGVVEGLERKGTDGNSEERGGRRGNLGELGGSRGNSEELGGTEVNAR